MRTWEAQLMELESLMRPVMAEHGLAAFCRADLWLDHPALKAACERGERLFTVDPVHGVCMSLPMLEAFAGAVPSPQARDLADWARMTWLDLKDGNEA